ncbi:MAG: restriction endonuclease subunit S [Anaerolineales bacterium]|nr:MAG: restriction endonuclease subunit S [Anaerolineales bacterium]
MNSDWQWVQLGEISEVISKGTTPTTHGVAFLDSGIPFLRAEDVVGGAVDVNSVKYYIDEKTHNKLLSRSQLQPGDFLITIAGSLGRVGYVPLNAPPLNCNQAVAFVRLKPNTIDLNFLLYVFQYEGITKSLLDVQKVGTIGNLNLEQIRDFQIPLPPLTEQKRIASLLARADRLRGLRRAAREQCDSLLQSVFLEMFGGENNFDRVDFEELLEEDPKNGFYLSSDHYGSGTPIIRIDAFYDGVLENPSKFKRLQATKKQIEEFKVQNGEILINRVNSLEYLGKCALVKGLTETTLFESNMMRIRINRKLAHPVYITKYLTTQSAYSQIIQKAKKAVNQASINQQDVKSLIIPVPPLALQEEFARVVARVEALRARMDESARQGEALFQSLLAESFGGDVT